MAVNPISAVAKALPSVTTENKSFKDVLNAKKIATKPEFSLSAFERPINDAVTMMRTQDINMPQVTSASMIESPAKMLKFQYTSGLVLLRFQMVNRTTEVGASTVKNFLQTQI